MPILTNFGPVCKLIFAKTYIAIFVSFSVKAVHLELATDLTTAVLVVTLCCFVAQRRNPSIIWSDHSTNFVHAAKELKELGTFLKNWDTHQAVSEHCTMQDMQGNFYQNSHLILVDCGRQQSKFHNTF